MRPVVLLAVVAFAAACSAANEDGSSPATTSSELGGLEAYDAARGNRIADRALALWSGRPSRNLCLAGVEDTLESSGAVSPAFPRLASAVDFDDWARANPVELASRGFQRQEIDPYAIPRGSIITWRPGQCGYHALYGHIEIVTSPTTACSDYCGSIARGCGAPGIYVPVGGACSVMDDRKLHCSNAPGVAIHEHPWAASAVVDTLRSAQSWFSCWFPGEPHAGGNTTWYWTQGDDHGSWGFVPASALYTPDDFDANPSARGLVKCGE